ncbi:MAG: right-handed parallel beta-helix repeat-containing protein [Bacteroidales bacterium]|jgi:hypothetical protein|nr:right-handed parallel beta-helix repeat-containing protein [Bacteroidales bacterium]
MKKVKSFFCFAAFCLMAMNVLSAQRIFVSPQGSDTNPGTADKPVATLNAAVLRVREIRKSAEPVQRLEIIISGGEYTMTQPLVLTAEDSGTEESPLIIRAEQGQKAIIRGGVPVEGWELVSPELWRAFIPQVAFNNSYFEQLYVNGERAIRARTPDEGFLRVRKVNETVLEKGTGRAPELAVQKIGLDPADAKCLESFTGDDVRDALIIFYHNWDNTRKRITGFSKDSSMVYTVGEGMKPWNPVNAKSRYLIENFREALNAPGEWFLERTGYLYYIPKKGETPSNTTFQIPVLKEFVIIRGGAGENGSVENIRFENLVFEVAGYLTPSDGNEPAQAAAPVGAVITADYARDIAFENCEIAHTGTYAFWFRRACSNCSVTGCYMHDLGAGGIKIGETVNRPDEGEITSHITADNNIIRDAGHVFPCAVGVIIFNASDNKITHNEIADLRYTGISVGWVWGYAHSPSKRNEIRYNHIHHLGWGELCDMGGVYTLGASEGTVVSDNHIHHVYSFDYGGWGLYTDEGSYGIKMENNLVYMCKNSGFHQHYGKENLIRNNIFAFNLRSQLQATRIEDHRSLSFMNNIVYYDRGTLLSSNWHKFSLLTDYNLYWDTRKKEPDFAGQTFDSWKKSGKDVHSVIADPMFVNARAFDFRFSSTRAVRKIRFMPFDYSKAGVYGSDEWKSLATFDPELAKRFDGIISEREK